MSKKTIAILKSFFETGDRPTEQQFGDLIDSFHHKDTGRLVKNVTESAEGLVRFEFEDATFFEFTAPKSAQISFIEGLQAALNGKVDKIEGKGLSTLDFTNSKSVQIESNTAHTTNPDIHVTAGQKTSWDNKVDKEAGKGLSTNDYDAAEAQKVADAETHRNNFDLHVTAGDKKYWGARIKDFTFEEEMSEEMEPVYRLNANGLYRYIGLYPYVTGLDTSELSGELWENVLFAAIDTLISTSLKAPLSANQGRILKGYIDDINALLNSDDTTLNELQEIVDYIKMNKTDLENLGISNIAGLQTALDAKLDGTAAAINAALGYTAANKATTDDHAQRIVALESKANTSLLTKVFDFTGGSQVLELVDEFFQIQSVEVNTASLAPSQYNELPPTQIEIVDPLTGTPADPDTIVVKYWKDNTPENSASYTKTENDALLETKQEEFESYTDEKVTKGVYGIEYDKTIAAPEVARIGDYDAHGVLPVQSKMRRCLVSDDGTVNYYLDANNSTLREDGEPAVLDGSHGQVMVEIPRHWRKFESDGTINRAFIAIAPFSGAHEVPKMYVSAYKAALDRPNNKLASVLNDTADFRGGNNQSEWDLENPFKSQLIKPVTNKSRIDFRASAQNRGSKWFDMDYQARKSIYWLITIEFATRNHQSAFNSQLTPEGFKQGALGEGPTNLSGGDWSTFNGYYPLYQCGLTNSLGNKTGEVPVVLQDFPTAGLTKNTQAISYRGVENFFGDIWEWTNGANIKIAGGIANAYIATGSKKSDSDYLGYKKSGALAAANEYISGIQFGEEGDILPSETSGASSTTYFSDYFNLGSDGLRGLLFGGTAANGSSAGSSYVTTHNAPSYSTAHFGSRLCFFP